jgi:hypothetical protein
LWCTKENKNESGTQERRKGISDTEGKAAMGSGEQARAASEFQIMLSESGKQENRKAGRFAAFHGFLASRFFPPSCFPDSYVSAGR